MNERLTTSDAGLRLIKSFEGCEKKAGPRRFRAYVCPAGVLTIGWGHTKAAGRPFDRDTVWTAQQCDDVLIEDLAKFEDGVRQLVRVELEQHQFDALVSFAFNCGIGNLQKSTLLRKINKRDFDGAAREFAKWNKGNGRVMSGLTRRRAAEATLFQGAGMVEVNARADAPMAQAVDPPAKPGIIETVKESKIAQGTGVGSALGSGNEMIAAVKDSAAQLREAKGAAEEIGLWDLASSLAQQSRFWIALAILSVGAAVIYWRWRDHA